MEKHQSICEDFLHPYIVQLPSVKLSSDFQDWTLALNSNQTEIIVEIDTTNAIICSINELRSWHYFKKKPSAQALKEKVSQLDSYNTANTGADHHGSNPIVHLESEISRLISKILMGNINQDLIVMKKNRPEGKVPIEDLNKCLCDIIFFQQRELAKSRDKKHQSDELIEIIGHDIRSPLGIILISCEYIKSLKDDPITLQEDLFDSVERIQRNSKKGLELLNSILSLSKAKTSENLMRTVVDSKSFLDEVIDDLRTFAKEKHIIINVQHMIETRVNIDKNRISEIIENIVGNAIKFTPNNKSILITSTELSERSQRFWRIAIKDDGPGIPAAQMKNIFQKFTQLDTGAVKKLGYGLGLAISQQFAELHGGQIFVESELGKGTTFIIEIPDCFTDLHESTGSTKQHLGDQRKLSSDKKIILIAHSDAGTREFAATTLTEAGFEVLQAQDGMEAFLIIKKKNPELIISDSDLTEISGGELLELTRLSGMNTPFVLTGQEQKNSTDDKSSIDLFKTQNITKPFTADFLLNTVLSRLGRLKN